MAWRRRRSRLNIGRSALHGDLWRGAGQVCVVAACSKLTVQARKDRVRFKKSLSDTQETDFTVQMILEEDAGLFVTDGGLFRVLVQA